MEKSHVRILFRLLLLSLIVCVILTPCVLAAKDDAAKSSASKDKLVLTPGGYRPESKVHEMKPGESLRVSNGHMQKIGPKGAVLEDYGEVQGTRTVPTGTKPLADGWISYASWTRPAGTLIDSFTTTWTVPPAPATDHGQTIFLFNGIQNAGFIFQPVLQWGPSAAGGGSYWTITNWYVDGPGGDAWWTSPLLTVTTGDTLTGIMTRTGTGPTPGNYDYISQFQGKSAVDLVMTNIPELYWFIETLEVYDVQSCSDYPNTDFTQFSNIEITDSNGGHPTIQWAVNNPVTDCGQHTCIISNANPGGIVDIHYSDEAPTAAASGPYFGDEGTAINFDGTGSSSPDGDALTYAWNFGDGSSGTGATPTHSYCDNGVYTVTLTITECGGLSATATTTATVDNLPPIAVAKPDTQTVYEGFEASFDGTESSDPGCDTLSYLWDFGGGYYASVPVTTFTFCDIGDHVVTLTVSDGDGGVSTDTVTVTVTNVVPDIDAGLDQTVDEGETVSFSGSATSDAGYCDTLSYSWDFGDYSSAVTGTLTPTHVYCDNGTYTVTLTVTDDEGTIVDDTLTVTVNNVPPVAEAGPDQNVDEGDTVSFSGSATDVGTCDTLSYSWDFGDGSSAVVGQTSTHEYCDNGIYTVTLTVTDDDGDSGTDTLTVTVNNVAPTVTKGAMDQPNPEFILPLQTLSFEGTFSDPGWCDTHTALWSFGDGQTSVGTLTEENLKPDATGMVTATHAYSAPGDYSVTVTVTDKDGGATTSGSWEIHVADVAEAKHILAAYIQGLPASAFKGKADQRKAAFANMFDALDDMIDNEEWNGFITSLQSNIREKADGHVDGKPNDDWITDKVAQEHICMKIDDIVAYVETFM